MATTYQSIIDAIDARILAGVDGPAEWTLDGHTIKYNSLLDLLKIRDKYVELQRQSNAGTSGIVTTVSEF